MIKKIKYISFLILTFFLIANNVIAEIYTVVKEEEVSWNIEGGMGSAPRVTLQDESGNRITAWCKDAYAPGAFYLEDGTPATYTRKSISSDVKAMYQSIFDNTCGDERTQAAATRAAAIDHNDYNGTGKESTIERYEGLISGDIDFGDSAAEAQKFKDVMSAADTQYKSGEESSAKVTQIGKTTYMIETESEITSPYCTERSENKWYCDIAGYCSLHPGDSVDVGIGEGPGTTDLVDGTDSDGNPVECLPCEVMVFTANVAGVTQELIACVDSDGNARGKGGMTDDSDGNDYDLDDFTGTAYTDVTELPCPEPGTPYDDECLPYSTIITNYSEGTEYCDENGKTVITIDEYIEEENIGDIYNCVSDGEDYGSTDIEATEAVLGDNKFCHVYCTEDFELELPGPTAPAGDDTVMVNAGTFFTIEKDITSTTSLTCIAKPDYKALVDAVNDLRFNLADAVTNLSYANSGGKITDHTSSRTTYKKCDHDDDPETAETRSSSCGVDYITYTYTWSAPSIWTWEFIKSGEDGGYYHQERKTFGDSCSSRVSIADAKSDCQSGSDYTKLEYAADNEDTLKRNVDKAKEMLESTTTIEPESLNSYLKDWNECFDWKLSKLETAWKDSKCNAKISFDYYDSYSFTGNIEVVMSDSSNPANYDFDEDPIVSKIDPSTKNLEVGTCKPSGGDYTCDNNEEKNVEYGSYSYKDATLNIKYEFKNKICNPYDESKSPYVLADTETCVNGSVFEGFPVSINTPRGQYWYQYTYYDLGHNYDVSCSAGRLETVLNSWNTNITSDSYKNKCLYSVNNCSNCNVGCESPGSCKTTWSCYNRCQISCVGGGCILDYNAGFLATYRTISLNEPFKVALSNELDPLNLLAYELSPLALLPRVPAISDSDVSSTNEFSLRYSSNWDTNKAKEVKDKIYDSRTGGENIYDGTPEYSFNLTPTVISDIRDYNETHPYGERVAGTDGKYVEDAGFARWESNFIDTYAENGRDNAITESYPASKYKTESFTGPALR